MTGTVSYKRVRNSCLKCRHRKIRCTRERPQCYNCLRLSHVCQYESPPPQAVHVQPHLYVAQGYGQPRLPPAPANGRPQQQDSDGWQNGSPTAASAAAAEQQHIRRRLGELEHAVAQLLSVVPIGSATAQAASDDSARDMIRSISRVSDQLGSLITEVDGEPRYRSASHWGQMIEDGLVSGLDGESATASLPLLLFSPDDAFDPAAYLPSRHEAYWLYSTFCSKVDPIVRIIHKPSFEQDMDKYFGALGDERTVPNPPVGEGSSWVKAGFEALLFAVLYSAVFSLEDEGFWQYTQQRGNAEQNQTQFYADGQGVESNLAHFMAFHETGVPSLYTIVGLLIRISRSFGLHIDPEVLASRNRGPASARPQLDGVPSGLAPALMEIRRRLWHQIIHLDLMASEARGIDPDNGYVSDLWPGGVGCSLPGNYDDDELAAAAHEHVLPAVPRDRGRHTDMSLQLVRFNASSCLRKLISLNSLRVRGGCLEHNCEIEAAIEGMVETNQTLHLQYCTDTEQGPYLTLMLGKMCACRARLHQYLFCNKRPSSSRSENGGQWSLLRRR
ncbi:hypothetical protein SCUCBS95973_002212 [Sporothrix curviconia]|uniref:Zn(2)-C6 fungal-type domain-containing protein n=1 Tax=Sporothrix curviconia TaxID=1260050 RepID=A0ABP0B506_9PEZI